MRDEQAIEQEIQDKGLNAPRLSPALIDAQIHSEHYFQHLGKELGELNEPNLLSALALGCLTICVLVLKNGFTVVGKSACASPANFDAALGRKIAKEDARNQIWALEGYHLRHKLANGSGEPKV